MSTQSTPGIDDAGTTDHPSRSDGFVRGMSSAIGGPLGDHATALDRPAGQERRFWTAVRIVLALACLTLALHWVQKSPCQDGAWQNNVQYTRSATPTSSPSTTPRGSTRARCPTATTRSSTRC